MVTKVVEKRNSRRTIAGKGSVEPIKMLIVVAMRKIGRNHLISKKLIVIFHIPI